jgi:ribosomal-protein-alanine N-acetyltransferase
MLSEMQMRAQVSRDIDRAMEVMEQAFDPEWGEAWNKRQLSSSLALQNTQLFLINTDGELAATDDKASGFLLSRIVADEIELLLIGVRPSDRGRGLATHLLDHFFEYAREHGAKFAFLEMRANNPAESLYKRMGFDPVGLRPAYYSTQTNGRVDAITFKKLL